MRLYWHPFSIIPRRVRIALREKAIPCEEVEVDLPGGAHRELPFRRLNPFGQIPVLEDGDLVVAESPSLRRRGSSATGSPDGDYRTART